MRLNEANETIAKAKQFGIIDPREAKRRRDQAVRANGDGRAIAASVFDLVDLVMQAERLGSIMVIDSIEKGGNDYDDR